jgi:predicted permease
MVFRARLRSFLKSAIYRSRMESEMEQEMRDHMERYTNDLILQGLPPEEAQRKARAEFGTIEARKDECRDALGLRLWNDFHADLRYALRMLRQSPAFTAVAILSLALGIGANTAIFSLAETIFLQLLPVQNPEALKILAWTSGPNNPSEMNWGTCHSQTAHYCYSFSYPLFEELRRDASGFSSLFAFKSLASTALVNGQAEPVHLTLVSGEYFSGLGAPPILGRNISVQDERQKEFVAVISDGFWEQRFGRDPNVLGKHISISDRSLTIIGVAPSAFQGLHPSERPDLFVPITLQAEIAPQPAPQGNDPSFLNKPNYWWVELAGRLKPDVTESAARESLNLVLQRAVKTQLGNKRADTVYLRLEPGAKGYDDLRFAYSKSLSVLICVVGLVLLIACANLANLLLARATARQREMGVRLALGAARGRLIRQVLTEGLALAGSGGALGLLLGFWSRNVIPSLLGVAWQPSPLRAHFDVRVLAFTLGVTLATGLIFGLAPALGATSVDVNSSLKAGSRGQTPNRVTQYAGQAIVVSEISLSALLLVGAGLFLRTLFNLQAVPLGFDPERIILFTIDPPHNRYSGEKQIAFFKQLEDRIVAIPGVEFSTLSNVALLSGMDNSGAIRRPGHGNALFTFWENAVGQNFFETMQIPILRGRAFDIHDRTNLAKMVVINETLAKDLFPDSNPIGQTLGTGNDSRGEVIGICRDAKYASLRDAPPPTAYFLYSQRHLFGAMTAAVRTHAAPAIIVTAARKIVAGIDKDVPILAVRTQTEQIAASLKNERLFAALTVGFGVLAVLLACIGIYGIMAYSVARRTGEIGIRIALGAVSRGVLLMILRETLTLTLTGIVIGIAASLALTRFVATMLYGLKSNDPITLVIALLLMTVIALIAGWLPARRASRLDPMVALRQE